MAIRITEIESGNDKPGSTGSVEYNTYQADAVTPSARESRTFKVEGTLHLKDAELLEKLCRDVTDQSGHPVIIELSDICFLDRQSAAVLCRMKRENVVTIRGLNLFTRKVVELVDESEASEGSASSIERTKGIQFNLDQD
jgi:anti-anti-sigma regulatory factor